MNDKQIPYGWSLDPGNYWSGLWKRYRVNKARFNEMWHAQKGQCAGCAADLAHPEWRSDMNKFGLKPEVDHDHATGKVRGLLCHACNDFLGKIKDDRERMQRLVAYLKRNGEELI